MATALAGWTPMVKHSSAMYMLPMPARLRWSSSAWPIGRRRLVAEVGEGALLVPVGAEQVGTEVGHQVGLLLPRHELDDAELEADGLASLDAEHESYLGVGTTPPLAVGVDVPRALHLEVGVDRPGALVVDAGEEVLAAGQRADDGALAEVDGGEGGHAEVGEGQPVTGEGAVELGCRAVDGVSLRHAASTPWVSPGSPPP